MEVGADIGVRAGIEVSTSVRPSWMEVDLGALRDNYARVRELVRPGMKIFATVKANGYGHGAVAVASVLDACGVFGLQTASFSDALAIRRAGINKKIVMLASHLPDGTAALLEHDLVPTIYNMEGAAAVSESAAEPTPVYIKVDCGLGRVGVPIREAEAFIGKVADLPRVVVEGLYSHFPFADRAGLEWTRQRHAVFQQLISSLQRSGISIPITQALSSNEVLAGMGLDKDDRTTAICVGHLFYGLRSVSEDVGDFSRFRPVLKAIKARLIHLATHPEERSAGVGGRDTFPAGMVTGAVPIGILDGYRPPRVGKGEMLVHGRRVPVIGHSLAHTWLDLSGVDDPAIGDEVVVVGQDGRESITIDEVATWHGSSPLEAVMSFDGHLRCVYEDSNT